MLFVFPNQPWMQTLESLQHALKERHVDHALSYYQKLLSELVSNTFESLPAAVARTLLSEDSSLSSYALQGKLPEGLLVASKHDIDTLLNLLKHDWHHEVTRLSSKSLPPLKALALAEPQLQDLIEKLTHQHTDILEYLLQHYRQNGTGVLGQYLAFHWDNGKLEGIQYPVDVDVKHLVGLERQLERLQTNTLAFIKHRPAQHTLLYGPRGSGKSTAVRSLLKSYASQALRLIELSAQNVLDLPKIVEHIRLRPHRYIVFIDDLSFEQGDNSYHPLKSLLEGSLTQRPENLLIYATSNRRHLVKENFSDRPDPLNEDVHAWDTHNERLALADRFGLTITFPDASQQRYLEIVRGLVNHENLTVDNLEEAAIRFAEWGNGYSGRTAQQFVDSLKARD